jgi:RNA polymerase sigma-70 factor, ECF subfamily
MKEDQNQWQSGDPVAFKTFFYDHERLVLNDAFLITGSREDAQDILIEVFAAAWSYRRTFNPDKGKPSTWLHRITVNKCIEKMRKKQLRTVPIENAADIPAQKQDDAEILEDRELVEQAMQNLDSGHKAPLVLRYFNELSYAEIAEIMNIPTGTVRSRLHYALEMMKQVLSEE